MPLELPAELIDKIVGNLKGDHDSLRACSLVAHWWLPSAHRVIFSAIHVKLHECGGSLESFIDLLSSSEAISHGIQDLTIVGRRLIREYMLARAPTDDLAKQHKGMLAFEEARDAIPKDYNITTDQLFFALKLLPCLRNLVFTDVEISHVVPVMVEKESPCLNLKAIVLQKTPINSLGLYVVIASLPYIKEIQIESPQVLPTPTKDFGDPSVSHHNQVSSDHVFELPVVVPPGVDPDVISSLRSSIRLDNLYHFYISFSSFMLSQRLLYEWGLNVVNLVIDSAS